MRGDPGLKRKLAQVLKAIHARGNAYCTMYKYDPYTVFVDV